jgi:hypothetical protein
MDDLRIVRRLAVGGMAEVFLAEPAGPAEKGAPIVVKRLLPGADEAHQRLFERERAVLARVDSAHVVRLLGSGRDHLRLEYVDGPDLAAILDHLRRRGRRMPIEAVMAVMEGLVSGLADLHEATGPDGRTLGAVHRDVNPSNVLVSREGRVKLADLGVVHVEAGDEPTIAGLKGTLSYMAPEQLLGRPVDRRADLYAAGLVAWESLTGVPARPAGMTGIAELLDARTRLPSPPGSLRPDVPPALDAVVLAALEPDPAARPSDARSWLLALAGASGVAADPGRLAEVAGSVDRSHRSAARTLAAGDNGASPEARRPAWRIVASIGALAAAAVAIAVWAAYPDRVDPAPADTGSRPPVIAAAPPPPPAAATPAADPVPSIGISAARHAGPAAAPVATRPAPRETARPSAAAPVLEIAPDGGPLHVEGGGAKGLAPIRTGPLAADATLLTLHGGPDGMPPAIVRVQRSGDRLTASIGTRPDRHFNRISCGGRDVGETSAVGIPLAGATRCSVFGDEGSMAFALVVVQP